mmetsp:Transcript_3288/g.6677  ORF Transcript_3288/g.6677 Transcript_3288/m.6677 type:complete len:214 (+) Transcript_3288:401-1042(+)
MAATATTTATTASRLFSSRPFSLPAFSSFPLSHPPLVSLPIPALVVVPPAIHFRFRLETANQRKRYRLGVQKVAESPPAANLLVEIPAACLSEIRDRAEFHLHLSAVVQSAVHGLHGVAGVFLVEEFAVDVADHVVAEVVADVEFIDPTKLGEFHEHVLVERKIVFEGFYLVDFALGSIVVAAAAVVVVVCRVPNRSLLEFRNAHRMAIYVFD